VTRSAAECEASLAAGGGFSVTLLLFGGLEDERPDGSWLARVFVNRDEGNVCGCGVFPFAGKNMLGIDFDSYFHGSVEDTVYVSFQDYDFAEIDGVAKVNVVDAGRDNVAIRMAAGGHSGSDVHKVHDMATEKLSQRIGLCWKDDLGHFRARSVYGLPFQDLSDLLFQLACSAGAATLHGSSHLSWI
jgi:hypothetical protein